MSAKQAAVRTTDRQIADVDDIRCHGNKTMPTTLVPPFYSFAVSSRPAILIVTAPIPEAAQHGAGKPSPVIPRNLGLRRYQGEW